MQPIDPEVYYGLADRSFLDRNAVQMELLPDKLEQVRWKLNQKAKQEPQFRFYSLLIAGKSIEGLPVAWIMPDKLTGGISAVKVKFPLTALPCHLPAGE